MAFSKALYYPTIDISDEGWLKSAALYWKEIYTIVPSSIKQPYRTETAKTLEQAKVLKPLVVSLYRKDIDNLDKDIEEYLKSREGQAVLLSGYSPHLYSPSFQRSSAQSSVHETQGRKRNISSILPFFAPVEPNDSQELFSVHAEKLPSRYADELRGALGDASAEWFEFDQGFANFLMTLLATHLSKRAGAALLTDRLVYGKLASTAQLDIKVASPFVDRTAQGTLANITLEGIRVDKTTPVEKILKFREDYGDELGQFRIKVAELTKVLSESDADSLTLEELIQQVRDIYVNNLEYVDTSIKRALNNSRIKWIAGDLLSIILFTGSYSFFSRFGVPPALSFFIGSSAWCGLRAVLYNTEKAKTLSDNSFSYLFRAKRRFHHKLVSRNEVDFWTPPPLF